MNNFNKICKTGNIMDYRDLCFHYDDEEYLNEDQDQEEYYDKKYKGGNDA